VSGASRLPDWLTRPISDPKETGGVRRTLSHHRLNTVCDEARCPNRFECFARGTATFMILGDTCTRDCAFCAVRHGQPSPPDYDEPRRVASAAAELGLEFVVVTSVTRDDLEDGGASQFSRTVVEVRSQLPGADVEVLVPDFRGGEGALEAVLESRPAVVGHNVETARRLYPDVRMGADYDRTLELLRRVSEKGGCVAVKSAMMLGLGETRREVEETLTDLRDAGVDIVCLGQYLSPTRAHVPVQRFVPPPEFDELKEFALGIGMKHVSAGPFVRSSYNAAAALEAARAGAAAGLRHHKERT
jgi:lipoyl synthase